MTPQEVADLLRYAASLDPWLGQTSTEEGAYMVAGWSTILAPVDREAAMAYVADHYALEGARSIQPGDILGSWRSTQRAAVAQNATDNEGDARARMAAEIVPGMGGSLGLYLRQCLAAVTAGGRVEDVPLPENRPRLDPHTDAWQRRCSFHTICACSHTECRGGFLDAETQVVDAHGRSHEAVKRCVVCNDGILMAQERGIARRPRGVRR